GISAAGTLHVVDSTISDNTASATSSGNTNLADAIGGGIAMQSDAALTLSHSTVSGNSATGTNTAGSPSSGHLAEGVGGGIFIFAPIPGDGDRVSIDRSTIGGNSASATGTGPSQAFGGGIDDQSGAAPSSVDITSGTITKNAISVGGPATTQGGA